MWPSGIYVILTGIGLALQQQAGGPLTWEQIVLAATAVGGVLGTIGGLMVKGVVRFGYQVDGEQKLMQTQIDDLKKQVADERAEGEKRLAEYVAQSNQRLADTNTEWRGRYNELGQDRDFWRQNAMKPIEAVERLTDVVEALKRGLEHDG